MCRQFGARALLARASLFKRHMWLQALLTPADLESIVAEMTPVQIALDADDPKRYLWLDRPTSVEMVGNVGVRIVTSARLQWDVIGIALPITLRSVSVVLTPSVAQRDGKDALLFAAQVESADLAAVPVLIEVPLVAKVNEALTADHAKLAWCFTDTLDFTFQLPDTLAPARSLRLFARWGAVRTSEEGVAVAASFGLDAEPLAPAPGAESIAAVVSAETQAEGPGLALPV